MGKGCKMTHWSVVGQKVRVYLEQFWFHMRLPEAELQWQQSHWKTTRCLGTGAGIGRSESLDLKGVSLGSLEESTKHRDLLHPGSIVLAHSSSLHWLSGIKDAPGIWVEDPVFSIDFPGSVNICHFLVFIKVVLH